MSSLTEVLTNHDAGVVLEDPPPTSVMTRKIPARMASRAALISSVAE